MNVAYRPTETELRAHMQHAEFHRKIALRAASLERSAPLPPVSLERQLIDLMAQPPEKRRAIIESSAQTTPVERDILLISSSVPPMIHIKNAVCDHYRVRLTDLLSARRSKKIVIPRQVAAYLCKELTLNSLPAIGRAFGNRDHTTILHAVRKITHAITVDTALAASVAKIRADLETLLP